MLSAVDYNHVDCSMTNSCGFEHVFVGETREHDVTGFHNWIQFYLQEKAGRLDYRGYFRRGTVIQQHILSLAVFLLHGVLADP